MRQLAIGLMVAGAVLLMGGALLWLLLRAGVPLGRLPGDLAWRGKGWSFHFPVVTCILLSLLLTLLLNLFMRRQGITQNAMNT